LAQAALDLLVVVWQELVEQIHRLTLLYQLAAAVQEVAAGQGQALVYLAVLVVVGELIQLEIKQAVLAHQDKDLLVVHPGQTALLVAVAVVGEVRLL
jgi:hypothetical protein